MSVSEPPFQKELIIDQDKPPGPREPNGRILFLQNMFNKYKEYWLPDRKRMIRNIKLFWGVDYAQWPDYIVQRLRSEGRQAPTINVVSDKIESLASQVLKNQFDIKYEPMTGELDTLTLTLQDMMYSDKELMDWDETYADFLVRGLVQESCERMIVSDRYNPMGNIGFISEDPFMLFRDPGWKSGRGRELESVFKGAYMDVDEIKRVFKSKEKKIEDEFEMQKAEGKEYGQQKWYQIPDVDQRWGSKHLVLEWHHIRHEKRWWEYDLRNGTPFPETDLEGKIRYAKKNKLRKDEITWIQQDLKRYYVTTVIPSLSLNMFFEDRLHEIQVDRLPFFFWGPTRFNGQFRGMCDTLYDMQININKNEMDMADIRSRAARGSFIIDPDIVDGDPERMQELERGWNSPALRFWSEQGKLAENTRFIYEIPNSHIPNDLFRNTERMYELTDRLGKVSAAQQARTEGSGESGRLFQAKYEAGLIATGLLFKGLETHWNDKAEAFMMQSKITYAGPERSFARAGGGEPLKVNQTVIFETGEIGKKNNIMKLPRHKVVITQSPRGINVRTNNRILNAELLKNAGNRPMLALQFFGNIVDTLELEDDKRDEMQKALQLEKMVAAKQMMATVAQANLVIAQSAAAVSKITGQQPDLSALGFGANVPQISGQLTAPEQISGPEELSEEAASPPSAGNENLLVGTPQQGAREIQDIVARQATAPTSQAA